MGITGSQQQEKANVRTASDSESSKKVQAALVDFVHSCGVLWCAVEQVRTPTHAHATKAAVPHRTLGMSPSAAQTCLSTNCTWRRQGRGWPRPRAGTGPGVRHVSRARQGGACGNVAWPSRCRRIVKRSPLVCPRRAIHPLSYDHILRCVAACMRALGTVLHRDALPARAC